jgi:hypothetical protein
MINNRFKNLRLISLLVGAGAVTLMAQSNNGSLSGRVTNPDGSPKAEVSITCVQKGTNLTRRVTTDREGNWRVPALPVGDYKVILESGGNTHTLSRTVNLGLDQTIRFHRPTEAGTVVVVEAFAAGVDQVNTTSAEVGINVDSQVLENLPIMDRNVNSAAVLAPGVQIIQGSQVDPTKKAQTYIVSGDGQGRGTNFNVDGADNNSTDVGGIVMPVPFDAIDQFQVVTNQYKAEFGRSNAGFMNMVTKSGTNEFAGIASVQYTNQNLRARRTDETPKLANSQSIYALTLSGPIIKDRLFFMVSGEMTKSNTLQTFAPEAVSLYPTLANESNGLDKHNLYLKVDWNLNQQWMITGTYARYYDKSANQTFSNSSAVGNYVDPSMLGTNKDDVGKYGIKATGTFGIMVWESTANYFNYVNQITPSSPASSSPTQGGTFDVTGLDANGNYYNAGEDFLTYQNTGVKRHQWKNELSVNLPEHALKFGIDLQQTNYPWERYFFTQDQPTNFTLVPGIPLSQAFSPTLTAADISSVAFSSPFITPPTTFHGYGFYAQDDWSVNPNWQVYYGVRVDWDTQLDSYKALDPIYAYIHSANPMLPGITNEAPRSRKYPSPRIQVLYKPYGDDNLTLKFGFGQFIASTIDNVVGFSRGLFGPVNGGAFPYFNGPFTAGSTIGSVNGNPVILPADLTPYNYANNVFGASYTQGLQTILQNYLGQLTPATPTTGGRQLLASNFSYPITQTVSFGATIKFNDHTSLDLTALYSTTKNNTAQGSPTDGSTPYSWSPSPNVQNPNGSWPAWTAAGAAGNDQSDSIFYSDQRSVSKQLQAKYMYNLSNFQVMVTFVAKQIESTSGGSGSFSATGTPDFFGGGAPFAWQPGPMRLETGTEPFSGSFSVAYRWDEGTRISCLGQWHSGKYYDIFLADSTAGVQYGPNGQNPSRANPNLPIGTGVGSACMDIGARLSHEFRFQRKMVLEPFLQLQNILNNYDYGTSYHNGVFQAGGGPNQNQITTNTDPNLGVRLQGYQANAPRTALIGAKFTF